LYWHLKPLLLAAGDACLLTDFLDNYTRFTWKEQVLDPAYVGRARECISAWRWRDVNNKNKNKYKYRAQVEALSYIKNMLYEGKRGGEGGGREDLVPRPRSNNAIPLEQSPKTPLFYPLGISKTHTHTDTGKRWLV
jgi:hypothetical protein